VARAALEARTGGRVSDERLENMKLLLQRSFASPELPPVISEFGEDFVVSISSRPMPNGGWVTTFEDITERSRSEARIAHMETIGQLELLVSAGCEEAQGYYFGKPAVAPSVPLQGTKAG